MSVKLKWKKAYIPPRWEAVRIVDILRHPPPHSNHTEDFEKDWPGRLELRAEQTLNSFWLAPGQWQVLAMGMLGTAVPSEGEWVEAALAIHAEPSDYWPQASGFQATQGFTKAPLSAVLHVSSAHPILVTVTVESSLPPGFLDGLRVIATRE